jgi:hypothetical protein
MVLVVLWYKSGGAIVIKVAPEKKLLRCEEPLSLENHFPLDLMPNFDKIFLSKLGNNKNDGMPKVSSAQYRHRQQLNHVLRFLSSLLLG